MIQNQSDSYFRPTGAEFAAPSKVLSLPIEIEGGKLAGVDRLGMRYSISTRKNETAWVSEFSGYSTLITMRFDKEPSIEDILKKLHRIGYVFNKNLSIDLQVFDAL